MKEYFTKIQLVGDSLAGSGHPFEEMQQISIILNGVKGQFDNVASLIHARRNPYDLASIVSVLLNSEARQKEVRFDNRFPTVNVAVKSTTRMSLANSANKTTDSGHIQA